MITGPELLTTERARARHQHDSCCLEDGWVGGWLAAEGGRQALVAGAQVLELVGQASKIGVGRCSREVLIAMVVTNSQRSPVQALAQVKGRPLWAGSKTRIEAGLVELAVQVGSHTHVLRTRATMSMMLEMVFSPRCSHNTEISAADHGMGLMAIHLKPGAKYARSLSIHRFDILQRWSSKIIF